MNVQFAIQEKDGKDVIYVLEVNPRASRTVPFVSKATGIQLAKVAARCMVGQSLASQGIAREVTPPYFSVKEAVFPFVKFPGVDTILGPEMKSTGEVMGVGKSFGEAFIKSQIGAGHQVAARDRSGAQGVPHGEEQRQAARRRGGAPAGGPGLPHRRHQGHRRRDQRGRHPLRVGQQGDRRAAARGRHDQEQRAGAW